MSRKSQVVTVVLFALVGVGLATQLYKDPWGLVKSILIMAAIGGLLYFLFNRFLPGGSGRTSTGDAGYQKALKQQKQRNKRSQQGQQSTPLIPSSTSKLKKMNRLKASARRNHPFRVIDGKKNKQKNTEKTKTS
ncbi:SA1362 family protein [Aneurinibacillus tyrosinisolvens]|uniref:SA1362 family protein n=1 Tax=Aneurinibacillus tyrosinisolvens TaxID=1443435 RepID=UPI00063F3A38|nr:SA1362 family protein [Aneurinibacillus tyrosinisolvens]